MAVWDETFPRSRLSGSGPSRWLICFSWPRHGRRGSQVMEPVEYSLQHFEHEVNRSIQETLNLISTDGTSDRVLLLQVLRNQVVVFAALSDFYHDVVKMLEPTRKALDKGGAPL